MSTKIYTAVRFPQSRFTEALPIIHELLLSKVCEFYEEFFNNVDEDKVRAKWNLDKNKPVSNTAKMLFIHNHLFDLNKKYNESLFECGFSAWFHTDEKVYVIPWGIPKVAESLINGELPDWIEEYGYWNNTDRPKHLSARQWKARAKKWEEVGPNASGLGFFKYRMKHEVCSLEHIHGFAVLEEYFRKKHNIKRF